MAEDTPFLNSLTKDRREYVAKKAMQIRPSYYSAQRAAQQESAGIRPTEAADDTLVQISADFEALLILTPAESRADLLFILRQLASQMESSAELDLMKEIVATRIESYVQLTTDFAPLSSTYDLTKQKITDLMVSLPFETDEPAQPTEENTIASQQDPLVILIPDLGTLFNTTGAYLTDFIKPEAMGVHDRIVDEMALYAYTNASQYRLRELSSWIEIINLYQTKV